MATIDLGKIKMVWRGAWNNATAYTIDDVVSHNGTSYICIAATTNNTPPNATYWNVLAQGGTDLGSTLSNNQIAIKNNSGNIAGVNIGTAGQILKVNSGANGYEFAAAPVGGLVQRVETENTAIVRSGSNSSWIDITGSALTITPNSASNRIMLRFQTLVGSDSGSTGLHFAFKRAISGGATTNLQGNQSGDDGNVVQCLMSAGEEFVTNSSQQFFGYNMSYEYIDYPNTTSAVTYTPIWYNGRTGTNISIGAVYYGTPTLNDEYCAVSTRTTALELGV